jgi:hypothetical protein
MGVHGRGTSGSFARYQHEHRRLQEVSMSIPNPTVTEQEFEEKRRQERQEEAKEDQRRKAEESLEKGLEDSFPASDPINVSRPRSTIRNRPGRHFSVAASKRRCGQAASAFL